MAPKINFTQAAIDRLTAPATGRSYYRDAKTAGLVLCVWDTGVKSFELYKRIGGRPTRLKIGRFPEVTVEQARKEVAKMTGTIAEGKDPGEARRKARGETTLGELFTMYLEGVKDRKRTWKEDQAQYDRYLTVWQARKLSTIHKSDVATLHVKVGRDNGHYAANRMLALLSAMFNYAADLGYEGANPSRGVNRFEEQSRDRFLQDDEVSRFFKALWDEQTPELWRDFFTVALFTGARSGNVKSMKWVDLELTRGLWKVAEAQSKNKKAMLIILVPDVVEILKRRKAANDAQDVPSEYVFPGRGELGHVFDGTKPWKDLLTRAKIKDLRMHDLRRSLGSWQAATGASLPIIGKTLGHKSLEATKIYARLDVESVRESVNTAVSAIMDAANGRKALPVLATVKEGAK